MDKADKVKEIVEKMQKRTPQKSKNPSLVQKEIKKELKKEDISEKKEEAKKDTKKEKVSSLVEKVKKVLSRKSSEGHGSDYDKEELKDVLDFFEDMLSGKEDLAYSKGDKGSLLDAQRVLKNILKDS